MLSSLWYLSRLSGYSLVWSMAASLVATVANLYLMSLIIAAFQPNGNARHQILLFVLLCITLLATRSISQVLLIRVTQSTVYHLQIRIARQVAAMEQDALEHVGAIPVLSVVADDVSTISALGQQLPALAMNICIFFGALVYLLHLSPPAFLLLLLLLAIGAVGYRIIARHTSALLGIHRREQEGVLNSVSALIDGGKELRLNESKHHRILEDIDAHADLARSSGFSAWQRHSLASAWSYTFYFLIIGVLIACSQFNLYGLDRRSTLAAVFGLLFMKGAIEGIFALIPTLGLAQVAFARIETVGLNLQNHQRKRSDNAIPVLPIDNQFATIRMVDVEYAYTAQRGHFHLGPLSLEIRHGEVVFIAGGNGAGKTSLLKILCGLYTAVKGHIEIDGSRITETRVNAYRQMFSAVFQEFHVFKHMAHPTGAELSQARHYLKTFQIDQSVGIDESGFTSSTLSRGQHKRLALLVALMEHKPILIFDEWAADQDPHFRAYFYQQILPELRSQGKTVVAVTHDESWYHVADRVLWLSEGQLKVVAGERIAGATSGHPLAENIPSLSVKPIEA